MTLSLSRYMYIYIYIISKYLLIDHKLIVCNYIYLSMRVCVCVRQQTKISWQATCCHRWRQGAFQAPPRWVNSWSKVTCAKPLSAESCRSKESEVLSQGYRKPGMCMVWKIGVIFLRWGYTWPLTGKGPYFLNKVGKLKKWGYWRL